MRNNGAVSRKPIVCPFVEKSTSPNTRRIPDWNANFWDTRCAAGQLPVLITVADVNTRACGSVHTRRPGLPRASHGRLKGSLIKRFRPRECLGALLTDVSRSCSSCYRHARRPRPSGSTELKIAADKGSWGGLVPKTGAAYCSDIAIAGIGGRGWAISRLHPCLRSSVENSCDFLFQP